MGPSIVDMDVECVRRLFVDSVGLDPTCPENGREIIHLFMGLLIKPLLDALWNALYLVMNNLAMYMGQTWKKLGYLFLKYVWNWFLWRLRCLCSAVWTQLQWLGNMLYPYMSKALCDSYSGMKIMISNSNSETLVTIHRRGFKGGSGTKREFKVEFYSIKNPTSSLIAYSRMQRKVS